MHSQDSVVDAGRVVGGPLFDRRSAAAATWALFCGIGLLMMGNGLNGAVLGVRSEIEGFGLGVAGVVMASYYAGFFIGSRYAVRLLVTVGHIRVFAALASLASSTILIPSISITPLTWAVMRFVLGACMAGLYVVAESWLNDLTTNETRARVLAVYMVVTMGGLSIGQLLLNASDPAGFTLFILASVLVSLSLVPVTLSASSAPPVSEPVPLSLRELARIVPTGVIGSFWVGASHGVILGIGAIYAASQGQSAQRIALFLAAPLAGAVLGQWPIGLLADRYPRRGVLLAVAGLAACTAGVLWTFDGAYAVVVGLMFVLGATSFPLYSVVVAYTNDWVESDTVVAASASLVRTNAAGAVVGPLVAAGMMALVDPGWFFGTLVLTHTMIAVYVGYRILVADAPPVERQRRFVAFPSRAGAMAAVLVPRRRRRGRAEQSTPERTGSAG